MTSKFAIVMLSAFALLANTDMALADETTAENASNPDCYISFGVLSQKNNKSDTHLNAINGRIGAKITPNFAVEGEATMGTNRDRNATGTYRLSQRIGVYGVGILPITPQFSLLGRVGLADTKIKHPITVATSEGGTSHEVGVGAQYQFNDDTGVRLDLTHSDYMGKHGNSDTVGLALVKKF